MIIDYSPIGRFFEVRDEYHLIKKLTGGYLISVKNEIVC